MAPPPPPAPLEAMLLPPRNSSAAAGRGRGGGHAYGGGGYTNPGWNLSPSPALPAQSSPYYAPPAPPAPEAVAPPPPALDAVAAWLTGAGFADYIPVFAENGFDTIDLLRDITDGELELLFNGTEAS